MMKNLNRKIFKVFFNRGCSASPLAYPNRMRLATIIPRNIIKAQHIPNQHNQQSDVFYLIENFNPKSSINNISDILTKFKNISYIDDDSVGKIDDASARNVFDILNITQLRDNRTQHIIIPIDLDGTNNTSNRTNSRGSRNLMKTVNNLLKEGNGKVEYSGILSAEHTVKLFGKTFNAVVYVTYKKPPLGDENDPLTPDPISPLWQGPGSNEGDSHGHSSGENGLPSSTEKELVRLITSATHDNSDRSKRSSDEQKNETVEKHSREENHSVSANSMTHKRNAKRNRGKHHSHSSSEYGSDHSSQHSHHSNSGSSEDSVTYDSVESDESGHDQSGHDHSEHDHSWNYDSGHDHSGHDVSGYSHSGHDDSGSYSGHHSKGSYSGSGGSSESIHNRHKTVPSDFERKNGISIAKNGGNYDNGESKSESGNEDDRTASQSADSEYEGDEKKDNVVGAAFGSELYDNFVTNEGASKIGNYLDIKNAINENDEKYSELKSTNGHSSAERQDNGKLNELFYERTLISQNYENNGYLKNVNNTSDILNPFGIDITGRVNNKYNDYNKDNVGDKNDSNDDKNNKSQSNNDESNNSERGNDNSNQYETEVKSRNKDLGEQKDESQKSIHRNDDTNENNSDEKSGSENDDSKDERSEKKSTENNSIENNDSVYKNRLKNKGKDENNSEIKSDNEHNDSNVEERAEDSSNNKYYRNKLTMRNKNKNSNELNREEEEGSENDESNDKGSASTSSDRDKENVSQNENVEGTSNQNGSDSQKENESDENHSTSNQENEENNITNETSDNRKTQKKTQREKDTKTRTKVISEGKKEKVESLDTSHQRDEMREQEILPPYGVENLQRIGSTVATVVNQNEHDNIKVEKKPAFLQVSFNPYRKTKERTFQSVKEDFFSADKRKPYGGLTSEELRHLAKISKLYIQPLSPM